MLPLTPEELETKRGEARRAYVLCGLLCVALLVALLLHKQSLSLLILAICLAYYFLLARPDIKGFSAGFRRANLCTAMGRHMDSVTYHGKQGLPPETVWGDELLPVQPGKSCLTFHRVTGEGKGMSLELSDVSFQVPDDTAKARAQFLSGCWVRIRLDHGTGQSLRLVSRSLVPQGLQERYFAGHTAFRPMVWENGRVDREFCSYGREGCAPDLSDSVLCRLMELVEFTPGAVAMGLEDDMVLFMLGHRFLAGKDPGLKQPVTQAALERDPLPELEYMIKAATACRRMAPSGGDEG